MSEKIEEQWFELRADAKRNEIASISNLGRVRYGDGEISVARMYGSIMLDRVRTQFSHIIASKWVPKTDEDIRLGRNFVDHITHTPHGFNINDFRNLRWCTHLENISFSEAKENHAKGVKGVGRSDFGWWFQTNVGMPKDHINEYAFYKRIYDATGKFPEKLNHSETFNGHKSEFSIWFNKTYGKGSDMPAFYNKCRRYYNETGKFYGGESC